MRYLQRLSLLAAFGGLTAAVRPVPPQEFVVIIHVQNPTQRVQPDDVANMFLKRVTTWPDGRPVEPVDLGAKTRVRLAFTRTIHNKSVDAVRAFWQQQIFSGRDVPPPEKGSEAGVIAFVRTHEGAIGYVSPQAAVAAGVIEYVRISGSGQGYVSASSGNAGVKAVVVQGP